jgi:hypothetical protein
MYLPITLASVLLLTFVILLLRIFWLRVPATLRLYLIWASVIVVLINIVLAATKLEIASDRMNVILKWLAVAGYELLLMLFTRLSPRWLTSICGLVLLVPVFAASFLMPLAPLFDPVTHALVPITANLAYQKLPWGGDDVGENSGIKLVVYSRPRFAPFLRRDAQLLFLNNRQCHTAEAIAVRGPDPRAVLVQCPRWAAQGVGAEDFSLPLP